VCWGDNGSGQCTISSDFQVMMPPTELVALPSPPHGVQTQQSTNTLTQPPDSNNGSNAQVCYCVRNLFTRVVACCVVRFL
jgi:hypothetical protein